MQQSCYNLSGTTYGCNLIDTACFCKNSAATQLLACAQDNCPDIQSFIDWAQGGCSLVGTTFEASIANSAGTASDSTDSTVQPSTATRAGLSSGPTLSSTLCMSIKTQASSILNVVSDLLIPATTSIESLIPSTTSSLPDTTTSPPVPTSSTANNGGLSSSDKIALGVGLGGGIIAAVGAAFTVYGAILYRKNMKEKKQKQAMANGASYQLQELGSR